MRRLLFLTFLLSPFVCHAITAIETSDTVIVNTLDESYLLKIPEEMQGKASYHLELSPRSSDGVLGSSSDPNNTSAVDYSIFKANKLFRNQDYDGAMEILFETLKKYPDNPRVLNMIGSIFFKLKDYSMARKYWGESLSLDGTQANVKKFLDELPSTEQ